MIVTNKFIFKCEKCGKIKEIETEEKSVKEVPTCCDQPMKNVSDMPPCDISGTSEHGRFYDEDEPCKEAGD